MKRYIFFLSVCTGLSLYANVAFANVTVEHAWVRLPPPVADTAAVYMTLLNAGEKDVAIVLICSDVSESSEVHRMRKQGVMMRMSAVKHMSIPAHGSVNLAPGGMHIMLNGLKEKLRPEQTVHLSLRFSDGSSIALDVPVRVPDSLQEPGQDLYNKAMALVGKRDFTGESVLLQQATEVGNRRAQYQLGLLYARGDGVKKDFFQARAWLRQAAMHGHPKAQFYLGQMHVFGDGGKKDNITATMWFWLATTLGDRFARDSLRVMTGKISPQQLTEAKKRAEMLWKKMPHDMKIKHGMAMH